MQQVLFSPKRENSNIWRTSSLLSSLGNLPSFLPSLMATPRRGPIACARELMRQGLWKDLSYERFSVTMQDAAP
ncbi:hypothetical protein AOLI_G00062870 [Acnodon oligacanthus]